MYNNIYLFSSIIYIYIYIYIHLLIFKLFIYFIYLFLLTRFDFKIFPHRLKNEIMNQEWYEKLFYYLFFLNYVLIESLLYAGKF